VKAQEEFLKWCPNVEGVSKENLEWVCWACGASPPVREKQYRPYRCHIEQYLPDKLDQPDNFILLCDRCHREQPDALPKEILKYWLATRESKTQYDERLIARLRAGCELLKKEFGDLVVDVAYKELTDDIKERCESWIKQYLQNRLVGQGTGNRSANIEWGSFAEIHKWCVANKDRIELEMQQFERAINAAREKSHPEQAPDLQ
jgi:hypothetical protein